MSSTSAPDIDAADPGSWVICLCAAWCDLCGDYKSVFSEVAARYPESCFAWLDIEDQADLVGDLDVETFPTLLIADRDGTRFFGPLTPHAETLARLLDSLQRSSLQARPDAPATRLLLEALRAAPDYWVKVND